MRNHYRCLILLIGLLSVISVASSQQDTSSFVPLGVWGVWNDPFEPPPTVDTLSGSESLQELNNWAAINGNYNEVKFDGSGLSSGVYF